MKKSFTVAAVAACALQLAAQSATAQLARADDNPSGAYVGAGFGRFNLNIRNLNDVANGVSAVSHTDEDAWKIFAGYRFNPILSVEAAYIDFGRPSDRFQGTGSNGNYRVTLNGFAPYIVGTIPLGPVELFGRAGYYFYDNDVRVNFDSPGPGQSAGIDSSHSHSDFIYGAGVGITVFDTVNIRAEYETVDIQNAKNSDALWLSAAWRF